MLTNTDYRLVVTRDYLNLSGGSVAPGGSVTFLFAATDNTPQSPLFVSQTPNRVARVAPAPASLALLGTGLAGSIHRRL